MKGLVKKNFGRLSAWIRLGTVISLTTSLTSCIDKVEAEFDPDSIVFEGIERIEAQPKGKFRVIWSPITEVTEVAYLVYEKEGQGTKFNFEDPIAKTPNLHFVTDDLRQTGSKCYIVRAVIQGVPLDSEDKEVCTGHEPFDFKGLESLTPLATGGHLLTWSSGGYEAGELLFEIRRRPNRGSQKANWTTIGTTSSNFFVVQDIGPDSQVCFSVKYQSSMLNADTNTKEICNQDAVLFEGITAAEFIPPGSGKVKWSILGKELKKVKAFRIYKVARSDEKRLLAEVIVDPSKVEAADDAVVEMEHILEGLALEARYEVLVKSVSASFSIEDNNSRVIDLLTANNPPKILVYDRNKTVSVNGEQLSCEPIAAAQDSGLDLRTSGFDDTYIRLCLVPVETISAVDENGQTIEDKIDRIKCSIKFTDYNENQNILRPRFKVKARLAGIEKPIVLRETFLLGDRKLDDKTREATASIEYKIDPNFDKRGVDLFCEATVYDMLDDSDEALSILVPLPDTPPIATGMFISKRAYLVNPTRGSTHYYDDPMGQAGAAGDECVTAAEVNGIQQTLPNQSSKDICEDTSVEIVLKSASLPAELTDPSKDKELKEFKNSLAFVSRDITLGTDYDTYYQKTVNRNRNGYTDTDTGDKGIDIQVRDPKNGVISGTPRCLEGTCTVNFQINKDYFSGYLLGDTDADGNLLPHASVEYRIRTSLPPEGYTGNSENYGWTEWAMIQIEVSAVDEEPLNSGIHVVGDEDIVQKIMICDDQDTAPECDAAKILELDPNPADPLLVYKEGKGRGYFDLELDPIVKVAPIPRAGQSLPLLNPTNTNWVKPNSANPDDPATLADPTKWTTVATLDATCDQKNDYCPFKCDMALKRCWAYVKPELNFNTEGTSIQMNYDIYVEVDESTNSDPSFVGKSAADRTRRNIDPGPLTLEFRPENDSPEISPVLVTDWLEDDSGNHRIRINPGSNYPDGNPVGAQTGSYFDPDLGNKLRDATDVEIRFVDVNGDTFHSFCEHPILAGDTHYVSNDIPGISTTGNTCEATAGIVNYIPRHTDPVNGANAGILTPFNVKVYWDCSEIAGCVGDLTFPPDWNGSFTFDYRVRTTLFDGVANNKIYQGTEDWSEWQTVAIDVNPVPDAPLVHSITTAIDSVGESIKEDDDFVMVFSKAGNFGSTPQPNGTDVYYHSYYDVDGTNDVAKQIIITKIHTQLDDNHISNQLQYRAPDTLTYPITVPDANVFTCDVNGDCTATFRAIKNLFTLPNDNFVMEFVVVTGPASSSADSTKQYIQFERTAGASSATIEITGSTSGALSLVGKEDTGGGVTTIFNLDVTNMSLDGIKNYLDTNHPSGSSGWNVTIPNLADGTFRASELARTSTPVDCNGTTCGFVADHEKCSTYPVPKYCDLMDEPTSLGLTNHAEFIFQIAEVDDPAATSGGAGGIGDAIKEDVTYDLTVQKLTVCPSAAIGYCETEPTDVAHYIEIAVLNRSTDNEFDPVMEKPSDPAVTWYPVPDDAWIDPLPTDYGVDDDGGYPPGMTPLARTAPGDAFWVLGETDDGGGSYTSVLPSDTGTITGLTVASELETGEDDYGNPINVQQPARHRFDCRTVVGGAPGSGTGLGDCNLSLHMPQDFNTRQPELTYRAARFFWRVFTQATDAVVDPMDPFGAGKWSDWVEIPLDVVNKNDPPELITQEHTIAGTPSVTVQTFTNEALSDGELFDGNPQTGQNTPSNPIKTKEELVTEFYFRYGTAYQETRDSKTASYTHKQNCDIGGPCPTPISLRNGETSSDESLLLTNSNEWLGKKLSVQIENETVQTPFATDWSWYPGVGTWGPNPLEVLDNPEERILIDTAMSGQWKYADLGNTWVPGSGWEGPANQDGSKNITCFDYGDCVLRITGPQDFFGTIELNVNIADGSTSPENNADQKDWSDTTAKLYVELENVEDPPAAQDIIYDTLEGSIEYLQIARIPVNTYCPEPITLPADWPTAPYYCGAPDPDGASSVPYKYSNAHLTGCIPFPGCYPRAIWRPSDNPKLHLVDDNGTPADYSDDVALTPFYNSCMVQTSFANCSIDTEDTWWSRLFIVSDADREEPSYVEVTNMTGFPVGTNITAINPEDVAGDPDLQPAGQVTPPFLKFELPNKNWHNVDLSSINATGQPYNYINEPIEGNWNIQYRAATQPIADGGTYTEYKNIKFRVHPVNDPPQAVNNMQCTDGTGSTVDCIRSINGEEDSVITITIEPTDYVDGDYLTDSIRTSDNPKSIPSRILGVGRCKNAFRTMSTQGVNTAYADNIAFEWAPDIFMAPKIEKIYTPDRVDNVAHVNSWIRNEYWATGELAREPDGFPSYFEWPNSAKESDDFTGSVPVNSSKQAVSTGRNNTELKSWCETENIVNPFTGLTEVMPTGRCHIQVLPIANINGKFTVCLHLADMPVKGEITSNDRSESWEHENQSGVYSEVYYEINISNKQDAPRVGQYAVRYRGNEDEKINATIWQNHFNLSLTAGDSVGDAPPSVALQIEGVNAGIKPGFFDFDEGDKAHTLFIDVEDYLTPDKMLFGIVGNTIEYWSDGTGVGEPDLVCTSAAANGICAIPCDFTGTGNCHIRFAPKKDFNGFANMEYWVRTANPAASSCGDGDGNGWDDCLISSIPGENNSSALFANSPLEYANAQVACSDLLPTSGGLGPSQLDGWRYYGEEATWTSTCELDPLFGTCMTGTESEPLYTGQIYFPDNANRTEPASTRALMTMGGLRTSEPFRDYILDGETFSEAIQYSTVNLSPDAPGAAPGCSDGYLEKGRLHFSVSSIEDRPKTPKSKPANRTVVEDSTTALYIGSDSSATEDGYEDGDGDSPRKLVFLTSLSPTVGTISLDPNPPTTHQGLALLDEGVFNLPDTEGTHQQGNAYYVRESATLNGVGCQPSNQKCLFYFHPAENYNGSVSLRYAVVTGSDAWQSDVRYDANIGILNLTTSAVSDVPSLVSGTMPSTLSGGETPSTSVSGGLAIDEGGGADEDSQTLTIVSVTSSDTDILTVAGSDNSTPGTINAWTDPGDSKTKPFYVHLTPQPLASGNVTVTIQVTDGENLQNFNFAVAVDMPNQAPGIILPANGGQPYKIYEDAFTDAEKTLKLSDNTTAAMFKVDEAQFDGSDIEQGEDAQVISITWGSSHPSIIDPSKIDYEIVDNNSPEVNMGASTQKILIEPELNAVATTTPVTITMTVTETNVTPPLQTVETFDVQIIPVNDKPTISVSAPVEGQNYILTEDTAFEITGVTIDEGGSPDEDTQVVTVSFASGNTTVIPDSSIVFSKTDTTSDFGGTAGKITLTPESNVNIGTLIPITMTVNDQAGLTETRNFTITVNPVNDDPLFTQFPASTVNYTVNNPAVEALKFDEGGDSYEDSQILLITWASSNTALLPYGNINMNPYGTDDATDSNSVDRALNMTPTTDATGSTVLTVTIDDQQGGDPITNSFVINWNGVASLTSASLDQTCKLDVTGTLGAASYVTSSGTSSWAGYDSITGNSTGLSGNIINFPTSSQIFTTTWNVDYNDGSPGNNLATKEISLDPTAISAFTSKQPSMTLAGSIFDGLQAKPEASGSCLGCSNDTQAMIVAGLEHSCSIASTGEAHCWGMDDSNEVADGTGSTSDVDAPAVLTETSNLTDIMMIAAGKDHTCVLKSDHKVRCYGDNTYGQTGGSNATTNLVIPSPNTAENVIGITAGLYHSCALLENGKVYCWGRNDRGQIGNNNAPTNATAPQLVDFGTHTEPVRQISAGAGHTCAVLGDNGSRKVNCWGDNTSYQNGFDDSFPFHARPTTVIDAAATSNAVAVFAGGYEGTGVYHGHTCVLYADKTSKCWGDNSKGQLGDGTTTSTDGSASSAVTPNLGGDPVTFSLGSKHSCALLDNKTAKCWGDDASGQLGDNTTIADQTTPANVDQASTGNLIAISAGGSHTCAIYSSGTVWCWGDNSNTKLGVNNTTPASSGVPIQVLKGDDSAYDPASQTCHTYEVSLP